MREVHRFRTNGSYGKEGMVRMVLVLLHRLHCDRYCWLANNLACHCNSITNLSFVQILIFESSLQCPIILWDFEAGLSKMDNHSSSETCIIHNLLFHKVSIQSLNFSEYVQFSWFWPFILVLSIMSDSYAYFFRYWIAEMVNSLHRLEDKTTIACASGRLRLGDR